MEIAPGFVPFFKRQVENVALSKDDLIARLHKLFPEGLIYADQYLKQTGVLSLEIHKQAKASGQSRVQWLGELGFVWRETGYVEPDMCYGSCTRPEAGTDPFSIADYVFRRFPLAGEAILTPEEDALLYRSASQTVKKLLHPDARMTAREAAVLVLETIQLLKNWSPALAGSDQGGTFWQYVFLQYGFKWENSEGGGDRLYAKFRLAVKDTLIRYRRFFASEATQRYYTSLLLHAMAPRQSIESLFNILFDFYVKNLELQYISEDISYKLFTKGMRARWDAHVAKKEDLQLRSDIVSSGLQALFRERPGYMAVLCDSIVRKMDALLRGEGDQALDTAGNYWDRLLFEWYHKKSATERVRVQGERRAQRGEYVATTADRIYVQYVLEQERVCLSLPKIRLPRAGTSRPILRILQNGVLILEDELYVTGDDLCQTTRSRRIALEETHFDFGQPPQLQVEILYQGDPIYQSGSRLNRSHLMFDQSGNERIPKSGIAYLFTGLGTVVEVSDEEGIYQCPHPGQLYRINLSGVSTVTVDGVELFADDTLAAQFRHHTSRRRISGLRALDQGYCADVFSAPFTLQLYLPEGDPVLRHQISVDGTRYRPEQLSQSGGALLLPSGEEDGVLHCVRVVDLSDDRVKYEYRYLLLPGLQISPDRGLYRSGVDTVTAAVSWHGSRWETALPLPLGAHSVTLSLPGLSCQLEWEVPCVQCTLMEDNAFSLPDALWHRAIDAGAWVQVQVWGEWTAAVMLDQAPVPPAPSGGLFELGNELRSMANAQGARTLWLSLRDAHGRQERYRLTTILFSPQFLRGPLEVVEGQLRWQAAGNFFGETGACFEVTCQFPEGRVLRCQTTLEDTILEDPCPLPPGRYPYQVFLRKKRVFSSGTAEQLVGDPREFALEGKSLWLGDAICWDWDSGTLKSVFMRPGCGIVQDLVFEGESSASGETVAAPCYSGTLYFEDQAGRYRPFNANPDRAGFELVNPVKLWMVNEHLVILRCVTDDAVYIDNRYSTIVNRSPSATMTREEQRARLDTPDYFEYTLREV